MDQYAALRANVGLLGTELGETLRQHLGDAVLERVEQIRQLSKEARQGDSKQAEQLRQVLTALSDDELLPVARAFAQFLNLANLAEQHFSVSQAGRHSIEKPEPLTELFQRLKDAALQKGDINQAVRDLIDRIGAHRASHRGRTPHPYS
ncbi:phosphoenolpyruvate carboxylase [Alishewanella longhuensis]